MGLINKYISTQLQQAVTTQLRQSSNYNQNVFGWLNNNQPVYLDDTLHTYVHEGYGNVGAVYECIDLILSKLVQANVIIYEVTDQRKYQKYLSLSKSTAIEQKAQALHYKAQSMEEVNPKEIQDILDRPNELQSLRDVIRAAGGYRLLLGNSYLYMNGPDIERRKWREMFTLPAQSVRIVSGGVFEPIKQYTLDVTADSKINFEAQQVVHIKSWNPDFSTTGAQLYGMSPFKPLIRKLTRSKEAEKEITKQLKNGGAFGLLSPKNAQDILTHEQKMALKEKLVDAKNAGDALARIFPMTIGMEWQQIGLNFADMMLLDVLKATDEDIYRALHVPLQFRSTDSSTFNNQSVAGKQLIYNAVAPVADELSEAFTRGLCDPVNERTKKKYLIELDMSALPEMSEDMNQVAAWLEKAWWITGNERREVMGWGKLENVQNMDTPLVSKNLHPIEMAGLDAGAFDRAIESEPKE